MVGHQAMHSSAVAVVAEQAIEFAASEIAVASDQAKSLDLVERFAREFFASVLGLASLAEVANFFFEGKVNKRD